MVVAAALGFTSVPLFFFLEHQFPSGAWGLTVLFLVMAVFFFTCQFFLSRGNPGALFEDWPVMLALDAVWVIIFIFMAIPEPEEVILSTGVGILLSCCGGTLAGAFAASMKARKTSTDQHISESETQ
jgi:hypothetical protein